MPETKTLYKLMLAIAAVFILYVLYDNFIYDPRAASFLKHKPDREDMNVAAWLNVMYVHVVFACLAMAAGAVNFSRAVRRRSLRLHRMNGYLYAVAVLAVVLTSGYMAPHATGGKAVGIAFNLLNLVWPALTITAIVKITKKQAAAHRKWMVRSYAFCFTNMLIHLLTTVLHDGIGLAYDAAYTAGVYGTLLLLPLAAEAVNARLAAAGRSA